MTTDRPGGAGRMPMFGLDVMTAMAKASIEAMEDWNAEVSRFVHERLEKDRAIQEEFSRCRSPAEFFAVYSNFMSGAMRDYAEETTRLQEYSLEAASSAQQTFSATLEKMNRGGGGGD